MYTRIESAKNDNIKYIKKLYMKKYRDEQGLFIIEGKKLYQEAVKSGFKIDTLLISDSFYDAEKEELLKDNDERSYIVTAQILEGISEQKSPEGIIAAVKKPEADLKNSLKTTKLAVLLDEIKDPGNMGTIIRSADAFGAGAVIVSPGCTDAWSPKTVRASMGSCFHVPIIVSENIIEDIIIAKEEGFTVIAGDLEGKDDIEEPDKALIVIGSESHGVSKDVLFTSNVLYKIPMRGQAESLNASVAASIMLYDISKKVYKY